MRRDQSQAWQQRRANTGPVGDESRVEKGWRAPELGPGRRPERNRGARKRSLGGLARVGADPAAALPSGGLEEVGSQSGVSRAGAPV